MVTIWYEVEYLTEHNGEPTYSYWLKKPNFRVASMQVSEKDLEMLNYLETSPKTSLEDVQCFLGDLIYRYV